jgi:hypothetical protein
MRFVSDRWIKLDIEGLDLATFGGRVEGSWSIQCERNLSLKILSTLRSYNPQDLSFLSQSLECSK